MLLIYWLGFYQLNRFNLNLSILLIVLVLYIEKSMFNLMIIGYFRREAHFCVFAADCDEPNYEKLVRGLCKEHKIPIIEVGKRTDLGIMVGTFRWDEKEGKHRKVVGCSCAVVKDYGRDDEAKRALTEFIK